MPVTPEEAVSVRQSGGGGGETGPSRIRAPKPVGEDEGIEEEVTVLPTGRDEVEPNREGRAA